jgi:secondary thiamine-phosphate synthase enzyme
MQKLSILTSQKEELLDITKKVQDIVSSSKIKEGLAIIQTQHTTAGLTINENADPDVKTDILKALEIFDKNNYKHSEGNSPAHVKSSLMGNSLNIIIKDNNLQLGTWQGLLFCEFDGPRDRIVLVDIIGK